jgi:hypothetical protein
MTEHLPPKSNESDLWTQVKRALKHPRHDVHRVENSVSLGYPDVDYCLDGATGWIELKRRPAWPKRASTIVKLPHYTQAQRQKLVKRGQCGGLAFLLVQVADDYLLFDWVAAAGVGLAWTRVELFIHARCAWHGHLTGDELAWQLKRR